MKIGSNTPADVYNALFRPARIAIVGGSESLIKPGGRVLKNIVDRLPVVSGIKALPIIEGIRGRAGLSVEVLTDYLERLGALVTRFPAIREMDLNPVKGSGADLYVVDARILMD